MLDDSGVIKYYDSYVTSWSRWHCKAEIQANFKTIFQQIAKLSRPYWVL